MIEIRKNVNFDHLVQVESLHGVTFSNENKGHKFVISCMRGGELLTLTGTVTARFMRSNNTTILIAGNDYTGIVDGKAFVSLPQDCYNVPGRFQMAIFLTEDGATSCIYACVGNVQRSEEGTLIDSGEAVPSLDQLLAKIAECEQATAEAEAAATKAVRYDDTQTLTVLQKAQARQNINGASQSDLENTLYSTTNVAEGFKDFNLNYGINALGRTAIVSGSVMTREGDYSSFLYAGSTFQAKEGYLISYAFWSAPMTASSALSNRISVALNIGSDVQIVIPVSCYVYISVVKEDGSEIPEGMSAVEFFNSGVSINVFYKTVKESIEDLAIDKINKNQGTENAGKALLVSETGEVTPSEIPDVVDLKNALTQANNYDESDCERKIINSTTGIAKSSTVVLATVSEKLTNSLLEIICNDGYKFLVFGYSVADDVSTFLGWWKDGAFYKGGGATSYYVDRQSIQPLVSAGATHIRMNIKKQDGTEIELIECINVSKIYVLPAKNSEQIDSINEQIEEIQQEIISPKKADANLTDLVDAQKFIADDWHFSFIDVYNHMGLGSKHIIPGTAKLWQETKTTDLVQREILMKDGVHPYLGDGLNDMYARIIAAQLAMVPPSYKEGIGETTPSLWAGRNILWMGTSIPAGSDPEAGEGVGATYPTLVSSLLGSTSINISKGSSCLRINASTGEYTGMIFNHFARAVTRTVAECDLLASNWDNIKSKISGSPSSLYDYVPDGKGGYHDYTYLNIMKNLSFENLLLPYLDGTNIMPDLFVIDYGHNDVRPKGIDGDNDLWITPSKKIIDDGILAEDTYMISDSFANLKTALNNDLSGIADIASFAATLNRNCFKGAVNFIITLIMRYNPYARIVIVSDYN